MDDLRQRDERRVALLTGSQGEPRAALAKLGREFNRRLLDKLMRESGAIEQDADVIMFVYRDEVYHPNTEAKGIAVPGRVEGDLGSGVPMSADAAPETSVRQPSTCRCRCVWCRSSRLGCPTCKLMWRS